MQALALVRMFIEKDKMLTNAEDPIVSDLLRRAEEFSDTLIIPSRKRLEISKWKEPGKMGTPNRFRQRRVRFLRQRAGVCWPRPNGYRDFSRHRLTVA